MIQIDMEMPAKCSECRMQTDYGYCSAMSKNFCGNTEYDGKPKWCPLKEVPDTSVGKWTTERTQEHDGEWYCSECGYEPVVMSDDMKYCPGCGRKMLFPEPPKEE